MKKIFTLIAALLLPMALMAQTTDNAPQANENSTKKEITKTGFNFGPLPAIAFDADKGFQLGAILNLYDFGDGINSRMAAKAHHAGSRMQAAIA